MIARLWVLVVGLEHVADIKPLGLKCGSKWFFAGVVDMFDLTQLLDAGVVVVWRRRLATRPCRSRTTHQDRHASRHVCRFWGFLGVMTRMSIHSVVAPLLAASLLTDTCRLTAGPGTREDLVAATAPVVAYIAPASAVFTSPAPLVVSAVELIQDDPQRSAETQAGVGRRRSA